MYAKDYNIGQMFRHKSGEIVTVIEENGEKLFEIENIGTFSFIDVDYILCGI